VQNEEPTVVGQQKTEGTELAKRTKAYALRIIRLYGALPKSLEAQVLGRQLLRSGTSVGAQYREGCRSRSVAEFVSKLSGALQELDETMYWLELLQDAEIVGASRLTSLMEESNQISAMLVASINTAKRRLRQKKGKP
jgi:four helix bundle protein